MLKIDIDNLVRCYPPASSHPNKQFLIDLSKQINSNNSANLATLNISKWNTIKLPKYVDLSQGNKGLEIVNDTCVYFETVNTTSTASTQIDFYLVASNPVLFQQCDSGVMNDEEFVVAEHPVLSSLSSYLTSQRQSSINPKLIDSDNVNCQNASLSSTILGAMSLKTKQSKTIIVCGARRQLKLNREVLYGPAFANITNSKIYPNTQRLSTSEQFLHNFVFVHAPSLGPGVYTYDQILSLLTSLISSFAGVKRIFKELFSHPTSSLSSSDQPSIRLHCNEWGGNDQCQGNKILIFLLMMIGANLTAIPQLIIHSNACEEFQHAHHAYDLFCREGKLPLTLILEAITRLGLERT